MSCCCHGLEESCPFGVEPHHVHKCLPRYLDLDGHCSDTWLARDGSTPAGCVGACWTNAGTVSCDALGSDS